MKKFNTVFCSRMLSKVLFTALIVIAVMLVYRCSATLLMPTAADAEKSGTPLEILVKGRELYTANCNKCHGLNSQNKFTSEQWVKVLDKMQKKAKINDEQRETIFKYLSSGSKTK